MAYIGSTPTTQSFISGTDYFNGTGSQTAFTLTRTVNSVNDIQVVVNNVVQQPNDAYTLSGTTLTFTSAPSSGTNNVYVRYLSTTTQSIAPSQNSVGWNQLDTNTQQDLGISFKNRIINGDMRIDQRNAGASVTPAAGAYTVDRWQYQASQASKFTFQQNAGSVTPPAGFRNYAGLTTSSAVSIGAGDFFYYSQPIEGFNVADLMWGTANAQSVTLSFWVRSSLTGTFGGAISNSAVNRSYPFSYTITAANTWEQKSITIAGDTTGTWLTNNGVGMYLFLGLGVGSTYSGTAGAWTGSFFISSTGATSVVGANGATFYITGVQLEKGTQATAFDNRAYGTELALCQRYFWQTQSFLGGNFAYDQIGQGFVRSLTTNASPVTIQVPYPVPMRAAPSVGTTNGVNFTAQVANSGNNCNGGLGVWASGNRVGWIDMNTASTSGWSVGQAVSVYCANGASDMFFSAEL